MIPADRPTAPLDRTGPPHLARTAALLAMITAALVAIVWAALELTSSDARIPPEVYQPAYPVTAPAWLEPPPVPLARPQRPPHPASAYTPGGGR